MKKETIIIVREDRENFQAVQTFYSSCGYLQLIQSSDIVVTASTQAEIVGVVRLAFEENIVVLRGMQVASLLQRQGIGSLMLKEIEKHIGFKDCFCLPHGWLESFYGQVGFFKISDHEAPPHLNKRLIENRKKHSQLIAMKRIICREK